MTVKDSDSSLPKRSHPAHFPPVDKFNRSTILFVTICSKDRKKILASEHVHRVILDAWRNADGWAVGRYVIMPDHIHLFCAPRNIYPESLKLWARKWKALATKQWPNRTDYPIWQTDFWDRQLRQTDSYLAKWEYVRNNPVRKQLCVSPDEWPYQGVMNQLIWHD